MAMSPPPPPPPAHCFQPVPSQTQYSLRGPQVQPDASYWHTPPCRPLCIIRPEDLLKKKKPKPTDPPHCPVRSYPNPTDTLAELQELHELKQLRDHPRAIAGNLSDPKRRRLQLSPLLQLRPPPIGAVVNRRRPDPQPIDRIDRERWPIERPDPFTPPEVPPTEIPVITTGRELARYFEEETPGLPLRHALNAILAQPEFRSFYSPPFQALIWCALDITIYSAQLAAWFFKWRSVVPGVSYRPRPAEVDPSISVLYDRRPNDTQSGDNGLRNLPPRSPGTPRHPSYPSGHTTTYAAGSELLAAFFPDLRAELEQLADNAGMARLWAGIHYRSDHLWGLELGRCVAQRVIAQLQASCICPPDPCDPPDPCQDPPAPDAVKAAAETHKGCCVHDTQPVPPPATEDYPPGQLPRLDPSEQPEVGP
jgi:PAP2 superfamily